MAENHVALDERRWHLGEPWTSIPGRKLREQARVGFTYWGYGGSACHPTRQVQPLAAEGPVSVLMLPTESYHGGSWVPADAYSSDGRSWQPIPEGIRTAGKHALVLRDLRHTDEVLDLGRYEIALGPNARRSLSEYLRHRVDKACARLAMEAGEPDRRCVVMRAELVEPYAVHLRMPAPGKDLGERGVVADRWSGELEAAWAGVYEALPQGWYVGRPSHHPERDEWLMHAFDPNEGAVSGMRSRERTAAHHTEVGVVREMASCLRELREGRRPS
jgi:hypothetical protein